MARRSLPRPRPLADPDQFDLLDLPEPTMVLLTYSGRTIDLEHPDFSRFEIEDIARPLAYQCRFVGNTRKFYSVAQHCVLASHLAPAPFAFDALMHDSEEAFTGDWPTPWKIRIGRAAIREGIGSRQGLLLQRVIDRPCYTTSHRVFYHAVGAISLAAVVGRPHSHQDVGRQYGLRSFAVNKNWRARAALTNFKPKPI